MPLSALITKIMFFCVVADRFNYLNYPLLPTVLSYGIQSVRLLDNAFSILQKTVVLKFGLVLLQKREEERGSLLRTATVASSGIRTYPGPPSWSKSSETFFLNTNLHFLKRMKKSVRPVSLFCTKIG